MASYCDGTVWIVVAGEYIGSVALWFEAITLVKDFGTRVSSEGSCG